MSGNRYLLYRYLSKVKITQYACGNKVYLMRIRENKVFNKNVLCQIVCYADLYNTTQRFALVQLPMLRAVNIV